MKSLHARLLIFGYASPVKYLVVKQSNSFLLL